MFSGKSTRYAFLGFEVLALAATVALSVAFGSSSEWSPIALVVLLLALAFVGQWLRVEIRGGELGPRWWRSCWPWGSWVRYRRPHAVSPG